MKIFFAFCAGLLALVSSPVAAQTGAPAVVVVQISVTGAAVGGAQTLHLLVSRGAGRTEATDVPFSAKAPAAEAEACQQAVAQLYREGYTLKGVSTLGYQSSLIFVKGP